LNDGHDIGGNDTNAEGGNSDANTAPVGDDAQVPTDTIATANS
jgi:hypothetical protein